MNQAYITALSYYLPANILDNKMISELHPEWSIDKIALKTGIEVRHISAEDEFASDMAYSAASALFSEYDVDKHDIDFVLLCTQSPDHFLPTTACLLQERLGLSKNCGALDFNLGCSGFIYGLGLAKALIQSDQAKNVLLITSETYTKYIHPNDKTNKTIFGDGAAAVLISKEKSDGMLNGRIGNFVYGTDGSGASNLIVKNGGARFKNEVGIDLIDENGSTVNDDYLYMDGKAIFNFTASEIPKLIKKGLDKNEISLDNVDLAIFHQANEYMLNVVRTRCNIAKEKFYVNFSDGGNTVSSTIPIALKRALNEGALANVKTLLLAGFGVGLSMGTTIVTIEE